MEKEKHSPKVKISRWDKGREVIKTYDNINEAVAQFMQDFNIKGKNTARSYILSIFTEPDVHYYQNGEIAWFYL